MADRVDDVVPAVRKLRQDPLGQDPGAMARTQLAAGLDHPLTRRLQARVGELQPDHIGERGRVEATGLQEANGFGLARGVQARDADAHMPSPTAYDPAG